MKQSLHRFLLLSFFIALAAPAHSATKTSAGSGNWSTAGTWSPSGVPGNNDSVIIAAGHTVMVDAHRSCKQLTIATGGTLTFTGGKKLSLNGTLAVYGTCNTNDGNLLQDQAYASFILGPGAVFNWQPEQNNIPHASLWINSIENFSPTSNLSINAWYDADVPLGSVVTGNFGNLTLSSNTPAWFQNDEFVNHLVKGTFTVDGDYIILNDINSASPSTTIFNDIILQSPGSYLDFYQGTKTGAVIVNAANLTINGGELNMYNLPGTGSAVLNLSGNLTIEKDGQFIGANNNDAITNVNVTGNLIINGGIYKGCDNGDGNHATAVNGNFTNNISVTPGEFYGVQDGNGNATLTVGGNLVNSGYIDLIWNSGFSGVGNGNGTMTVNGSYTQSQGDFRGIYNLTTTNAGTVTITVNSLTFTGGTFMGHYACHTGTGTNTYTVTNNLSITFSNPSDIFRLNGLNVLSVTQSTAAMSLMVGGNLILGGNANAEFKSSASNGSESVTIEGSTTFGGGTAQFNSSTSHASNLLFKGDVSVSNGSTWLSYSPGSATINMNGGLTISGGKLTVKNNIDAATLNVMGNYTQNGGTFSLYSNTGLATPNASVVNIYGVFTQTGGTINFNENASATVPQILNIKNASYNIGGNGVITSSVNENGSYFGKLNYDHAGNVVYSRTGSHSISRVSQYVVDGTTLTPATNIQIACANTPAANSFYINTNAVVEMAARSLFTEGTSGNAGVRVESGGTLKTTHLNGLYNGTPDATLNANNGMTFDLHPSSIIEYTASDNQGITGLTGIATETKHKYGILIINFNGTPDTEHAYLNSGNVHVRTQLQLSGELFLNDRSLVIESGSPSAISISSGFIKSETDAATNNGILSWTNMTPGTYIYPFGVNSSTLIPVTIVPLTAGPTTFSIATRSSSSDNQPFATGVTSVKSNGENAGAEGVIDRWWNFTASPGAVVNMTVSYRGTENTTESPDGAFAIQFYNSGNWTAPAGNSPGVTTGVGTVSATGISVFGPAVLSGANFALPIELAYFTVQSIDGKAEIKWATSAEKNNDFFTIERSANGQSWEFVQQIKGAGTTHLMQTYRTMDERPLNGKSYYRLKQTDYNGEFTYSPIRPYSAGSEQSSTEEIHIETAGPNPFTEKFTMKFSSETEGEVDLYITGINGQIVHQQKLSVTEGLNYYDYNDDKQIPPGNYIVTVLKGKEKRSIKIVKQ